MLTTAGKIWLCNGSDTDIDLPHGDLFGFSVGTWVDLSAGPLLQKFQNGFCIWKAPPLFSFIGMAQNVWYLVRIWASVGFRVS